MFIDIIIFSLPCISQYSGVCGCYSCCNFYKQLNGHLWCLVNVCAFWHIMQVQNMKSDKFVLIQLNVYSKCCVQTILCNFHGRLLHHSLIRYHHAINWLSIFCSYCDKQFLRISHGKSTCMRTWGTLGSAHLLSDQDIFMRCLPKWLQSYIFLW